MFVGRLFSSLLWEAIHFYIKRWKRSQLKKKQSRINRVILLTFLPAFQIYFLILLGAVVGTVSIATPPPSTGKPHQHPLPSGALSALD